VNGSVWSEVMLSLTRRGFGVAAHRDRRRRAPRGNVLEDGEHHPIGEVVREFHLLVVDFLLTLVVQAVNDHPARGPLDLDFHGLLEAAPFLHEMVREELESPALHEDGGLVVQRSIQEVEDEPARDAIPMGDANQFTARQLLSVQRAEDQEAVRRTLEIADRNLGGIQRSHPKRNNRQEKSPEPSATARPIPGADSNVSLPVRTRSHQSSMVRGRR